MVALTHRPGHSTQALRFKPGGTVLCLQRSGLQVDLPVVVTGQPQYLACFLMQHTVRGVRQYRGLLRTKGGAGGLPPYYSDFLQTGY